MKHTVSLLKGHRLLLVFILTVVLAHAFKQSNRPWAKRQSAQSKNQLRMEIFEGNRLGKSIWDAVWKLPVMQPGTPGTSPTTFGDAANVLKANILQIYGNEPSVDGAPVAEGEVEGLLEGSLFLALRTYYEKVSLYEYE